MAKGERGISRKRRLLIALALGLAVVATFWPVLQNEFLLYDDDRYVTANPNVARGLSGRGVVWALTTFHAANWHPLTWLSHMLDVQLFGLAPRGHHLMNLLLHAANTVLLFRLLHRAGGLLWRSAVVAALFGLHPLRVESVAWVAERKDLLSTLFGLLTLAAYLRYAARPRAARYLPVILLFALGLLAKPMLVTLPFVLLLLDYWPLGRIHGGAGSTVVSGGKIRFCIAEKLPLFAGSAASSLVAFLAQEKVGAVALVERYPLGARGAAALAAYLDYIRKMFWPHPLALPYPGLFLNPALLKWAGAGLLLAAVTAAAVWAGRRLPYLFVGWFWYLGTLVPVIGLVQVGAQAMADRYTYIPLIGLFLALVWGMADIPFPPTGRAARFVPAAAMLIVLAFLTRSQIRHWRDTVTLYEHAIAVTTDNFIAHYNMGLIYGMSMQVVKSEAAFREALRIVPELHQARYQLGLLYVSTGNRDAAWREYLILRERDPARAQMLYKFLVFLGPG